jgi:translation initiation factor IF-3
MARERGLDLVEVAPNAIPPVCRLMDYGKFRYEQSRKERESRRHQHVIALKEVRIKPKIGDHDLDTKGRQAAKFLDSGDKVKLTVTFRGREMAHTDIGKGLLDQLADQLRTHGNIEQAPRLEGRAMSMIMNPLRQKQSQHEKEGGQRRDEAKAENTQGSEETLQNNSNRQDHAGEGHEESLPTPEGATREAAVRSDARA